MKIQVLWDGTSGLSSLSEKTRKSNHLQMSLQRQHFLLSYLKTLSVGPAGVWTHDLPHGSPMLNQLSQPVGQLVKIKPYALVASCKNKFVYNHVQFYKLIETNEEP